VSTAGAGAAAAAFPAVLAHPARGQASTAEAMMTMRVRCDEAERRARGACMGW
jgi:hypothetical protein